MPKTTKSQASWCRSASVSNWPNSQCGQNWTQFTGNDFFHSNSCCCILSSFFSCYLCQHFLTLTMKLGSIALLFSPTCAKFVLHITGGRTIVHTLVCTCTCTCTWWLTKCHFFVSWAKSLKQSDGLPTGKLAEMWIYCFWWKLKTSCCQIKITKNCTMQKTSRTKWCMPQYWDAIPQNGVSICSSVKKTYI